MPEISETLNPGETANEAVVHSFAIAQVMLNFAAGHGIDPARCLENTAITLDDFQDSEASITPQQEMQLIRNLIAQLSDVPAAGWQLGLKYPLSTFGTWGFAMRTSRSLQQAMDLGMKFLPLSTAYCRCTVERTQSELALRFNPDDIPEDLRHFLLHRDMATGLKLIREVALDERTVIRLELTQAPPTEHALIEELLGIAPHYRSCRNALVTSRTAAEATLPTFDAQMVNLLEEQCRVLMQRRQMHGLAAKVRQQLLGDLGLMAGLDEVAGALNLAPRSLRRKLDDENTSFRTIVEETRQQLAKQLLSSTQLKLDAVAYQLGYADTPSFTRAYRRWFGSAPGEHRNVK